MKRRNFVKNLVTLTGLIFGFPIISRALSTKGTIIKTGYSGFDKLTGGLRTGELCVVAGRPSMGQSTFLDGIVINNAINRDVKTAFLRGDDCKTVHRFIKNDEDGEKTRRLMAVEDIKLSEEILECDLKWKLMSGLMRKRTWESMVKGITPANVHPESILDSAPIFYDDASNDIDKLYNYVRNMSNRYGIKLFVIRDMGITNNRSCNNVVSELSKLARELDIALVISTENKNRVHEDRVDKRPIIADLEESGLTYADKLVFIYRDCIYDENSSSILMDGNELSEVTVAINKTGGAGMIKMKFIRYAFEDLS